jgi:hypothetical protein
MQINPLIPRRAAGLVSIVFGGEKKALDCTHFSKVKNLTI